MKAIGIDLGGTRIKAVAIDRDGNILHQHYALTEDGREANWKQTIVDVVASTKKSLENKDVIVGISAPGLPNDDNQFIAHMPGRLQGLENLNWSSLLNHPTWVLNDAVAAMMAEVSFGSCKNAKHAVMLTLGTGVGGAILIDGKPYQGAFNKAGHIGHMVVDHEGDPDVTGMPGSLEECIGNCTIQKRSNGKFTSTQELLNAMDQGDGFAKAVWLKSIKQLSLALASITNILSPEIISLGGGITEAGQSLFEPLETFMEQYEWRAGGNKTKIVKATYGDLAGAIGAASFALKKSMKSV
jgi:glucokinase